MKIINKIINFIWFNSNQESLKSLKSLKLLGLCLLFPLSLIYLMIIFIRKKIIKPVYFDIPVIIIGNITVGGTGKTPLVIWMANFLISEGYSPAIVSRGYKSQTKHYPACVYPDSDPVEMGDEPVLLARRGNCPVIIDPNRVRAVKYIINNNKNNINIIISDDGLQHYKLGRKLEIVMDDSEKNPHNGFCLPAGPLREPVSRLKTVDFVIKPEIDMKLIPGKIYNIASPQLTQDLDYFMHYPVHAVAGIGHPERFFECLKKLGLTVYPHIFPDHYNYNSSFTDLIVDFNINNNNIIIMTEKDAVKCEKFADYNLWCLPIDIKLSQKFILFIKQALKR